MRPEMGDDYCIACCVSSMRVGKDMQFFGARANLAKCLLYAINGGKDELMKDKKTGKPMQVSPEYAPILGDSPLDFSEVMRKYEQMMEWLARLYVNTLNLIHYMHDKYCYEALEMALHDVQVRRFFATGIAGLSCAADSLSAIKYAKVYPVRNEDGIVTDFTIEGDYPKYGNNDDRADELAVWIVKTFMNNDVHPHHHFQRGVRQEDGQHARRQARGRTARPRRQPHARERFPRRARFPRIGRQTSLRLRPRRHLQHLLGDAAVARQR